MRVIASALVVAIACGKSAEAPPREQPAPAASAPAAKREDRHDPAVQPPVLDLEVAIDGASTRWRADAFAKVPHLVGKNNSGEARDVWSLRELAQRLVGPSARVIAVTGGGETKPIDAAAWADASRTPILHTTRRGTLKFRWADPAGAWGDTEIKDVVKLDVAR